MFIALRLCAEFVIQAFNVKVKVTLRSLSKARGYYGFMFSYCQTWIWPWPSCVTFANIKNVDLAPLTLNLWPPMILNRNWSSNMTFLKTPYCSVSCETTYSEVMFLCSYICSIESSEDQKAVGRTIIAKLEDVIEARDLEFATTNYLKYVRVKKNFCLDANLNMSSYSLRILRQISWISLKNWS